QFAAHRIGDVDLACLQRGKPRALVRDHLEDEALDPRLLAPVPLERLEDKFYPGLEGDELVRAGADGCLLEAVVADLLDIALGHDPPSTGRGGLEGQKVRPR